MIQSFIWNKTFFFSYCLTIFSLIGWFLLVECDFLFAILIFLWINMIYYSIKRLSKRILLFCFGISFFTFLIGRDGLENLFNHTQDTYFPTEINHHAYLCMILALLGVWVTFIFFNKNIKTTDKEDKRKLYLRYLIRRYSKYCFYATYPIALLANLAIAYFVIRFGYAAKFTDLRSMIEGSPIFYTVSKIELLLPCSFSIFVATLPSKKQFFKLAKLYTIYLIITLGTGGRAGFMLGILLIVIFIFYLQSIDSNISWISRKKIKIIIAFIPFLAIGGSLINTIRFGESTNDFSLLDSFSAFFYDQGVSSNAIKRAYELENNIPVQKDFYTFEFLHSGLPARILGNPVYQGNTIDHATKGGSFTHALGYTVMGDVYLSGRGPGTSYIAELYYDFGYIGVFFGSCFYGYILSKINNLKISQVFKRSVIFISITNILWAPRGAFSGFLSLLFAPTTIILLFFVFTFAHIRYVHNLKKEYLIIK